VEWHGLCRVDGSVGPWSTSCWWTVLRYARKVEAPFGTCGGIDDMPVKDLCFDMHHWDGFAEDSGGDFRSVCGALSRVSY
jgi:hypothetical protein